MHLRLSSGPPLKLPDQGMMIITVKSTAFITAGFLQSEFEIGRAHV